MRHSGVRKKSSPLEINRRLFLKRTSAFFKASCLTGFSGCIRGSSSIEKLRKEATHRQRRIILDDDGDLVYSLEAKKGARAFLDLRLKPILGTPVDSIAWCIMWGIAQGQGQTRYWETQQQGHPLNESISDPTPVMVREAQKNHLEIFGSIRMNDTHDAFGMPEGKLIYPLKVEHPECLLGNKGQKGQPFTTLDAAMWSGLNYAIEQVRKDRLWWIQHTVENYMVDGVDLNFFRMPWYFKQGEENSGMVLMNELIRRARYIIDKVSESRSKPILLGVRIPGTLRACQKIGLDVKTWLKENLVDRLLIGGGYTAFTNPAREMVHLGHCHDVPVYPCINCGLKVFGSDEAMRGAASNILSAGADGIYLWNYQYRKVPLLAYGRPELSSYRLLEDLGSTAALRFQNKFFGVDYHQDIGPYETASYPGQLPIKLEIGNPGSTVSLSVPVGDDVMTAKRSNRFREAILELQLEGLEVGEPIVAELNNHRLEVKAPKVLGMNNNDSLTKISYTLRPTMIKQGNNQLHVWMGKSRKQIITPTLRHVWLKVNYL